MAQRFAVVMAGGSGTRFWPASRAARPKQFLPLAGRDGTSLLQATVRRAAHVVGADHVMVVAAQRHAALLAEQLPALHPDNLLLEPEGRNTAPALAWASTTLRRREPNAVIAALPADAHVEDEAAFAAALERALLAAEGGSIVTLGIRPTRAETGYGYLELDDAVAASDVNVPGVQRVRAFVEKPDRARAQAYVAGGRHLWNCGMFCFRAEVMLREIERQLPPLAAFVARADAAAARGDEGALVDQQYATLPSVSIDFGVMERAPDVSVVPASFGWDDVGSWAAAFELADKDDAGNGGDGTHLAIDSHGCYVRNAAGKLVVLVGMQDVVVVDTADALLVLPRDRAQDVSKVVAELKQRKLTRYL